MKKVLVTGSQGQLGQSLQKIAQNYDGLDFVFRGSTVLDITDIDQVLSEFENESYAFCVNCAAYTNVELAEKEPKKALEVNALGAKNIALACKRNNTVFIHISTDYVFDGNKKGAYVPNDRPNPINEYGKSKLQGEIYIREILEEYYIIRTSWLYSEYGQNFYKTILRKALTNETLRVTDEQKGCPTHAKNLSKFIIEEVIADKKDFGIYHYTDGLVMTWYGFAKQILEANNLLGRVKLEKAKNYRTFAPRPKNSVLESTKV